MTTGIIRSKVRGVTFENRQGIIRKSVRPGMRLMAIREPNNPHGKNAIGLWAGKQQIGHLSSDLADELAPRMDDGKPIVVTVTDLTGNGPGESIGVNIVIDTQEETQSAATQSPRAARPMNKALIMLLLFAMVIVCGVAQSPIVAVVCVAVAAWLAWQWKRAGGRLM